jgi:hypothetical protein
MFVKDIKHDSVWIVCVFVSLYPLHFFCERKCFSLHVHRYRLLGENPLRQITFLHNIYLSTEDDCLKLYILLSTEKSVK